VKEKTLPEAFQVIYEKQLPFVNRNDNSGTDVKERNIWKSIGLDPDTFGEWYIKTKLECSIRCRLQMRKVLTFLPTNLLG